MKRRDLLLGGASVAALGAFAYALKPGAVPAIAAQAPAAGATTYEVSFTDAEWRQRLSPDVYNILRQQGTEPPGSSPLKTRSGLNGSFASAWVAANFSGSPSFRRRSAA